MDLLPPPSPPSALPYVSWSSGSFVTIPAADWENLYGSLQTLKAHVQEYPGCQKIEAFVALQAGGDVLLHCYSTWDTPEQLQVFLERGYTLERLLSDVAGIQADPPLIFEKVF